MKYPYGVGHIYSGKVVRLQSRSSSRRAEELQGRRSIPKHGNKLGIIDIQYQYVMAAAALAAGGKVTTSSPARRC